MSDPQPLPLRNVVPGDVGKVGCVGGITCKICNNTHCSDADNPFERKVSLVAADLLSATTSGVDSK